MTVCYMEQELEVCMRPDGDKPDVTDLLKNMETMLARMG